MSVLVTSFWSLFRVPFPPFHQRFGGDVVLVVVPCPVPNKTIPQERTKNTAEEAEVRRGRGIGGVKKSAVDFGTGITRKSCFTAYGRTKYVACVTITS